MDKKGHIGLVEKYVDACIVQVKGKTTWVVHKVSNFLEKETAIGDEKIKMKKLLPTMLAYAVELFIVLFLVFTLSKVIYVLMVELGRIELVNEWLPFIYLLLACSLGLLIWIGLKVFTVKFNLPWNAFKMSIASTALLISLAFIHNYNIFPSHHISIVHENESIGVNLSCYPESFEYVIGDKISCTAKSNNPIPINGMLEVETDTWGPLLKIHNNSEDGGHMARGDFRINETGTMNIRFYIRYDNETNGTGTTRVIPAWEYEIFLEVYSIEKHEEHRAERIKMMAGVFAFVVTVVFVGINQFDQVVFGFTKEKKD